MPCSPRSLRGYPRRMRSLRQERESLKGSVALASPQTHVALPSTAYQVARRRSRDRGTPTGPRLSHAFHRLAMTSPFSADTFHQRRVVLNRARARRVADHDTALAHHLSEVAVALSTSSWWPGSPSSETLDQNSPTSPINPSFARVGT